MVESILTMKRPLQSLMEDFSKDCQLNNEDWDVILLLHTALKPFMEAQKKLESSRITGSLAIPTIKLIRDELDDCITKQDESSNVKKTLEAMRVKFNEKFGDGTGFTRFSPNGWNASTGIRQQPSGFSKVQVIATALDPRFKDLLGIPIEEHGNVQLMVKQAVLEEITRNSKSTTTTGPNTVQLENSKSLSSFRC